MSVAPESSSSSRPTCWCCDGEFDEWDLVRLGSHPEVAVCFRCAQFLQRRVRERQDERRTSPASKARDLLRGARLYVVSRGWQNLPVLGGILRRLDRHLP